jgi:hypothetical protein
MYNNEAFWANIARNLANPDVEDFEIDDYIDQIKQELLESGEISEDNYLDEMRRRLEEQAEAGETEFLSEEEEEQVNRSNEMAAAYSGPTRIYYSLEGRIHISLPLPIYKCEGSGKVVLDIIVNPRGYVISATVKDDESTSDDFCLHEMAKDAASRSRFNLDPSAPNRQQGTLTYHFVAQ